VRKNDDITQVSVESLAVVVYSLANDVESLAVAGAVCIDLSYAMTGAPTTRTARRWHRRVTSVREDLRHVRSPHGAHEPGVERREVGAGVDPGP